MHAKCAKKQRRRRRAGAWLLALLLVLGALAWRVERNLTQVVLNLSAARASAMASTVLHRSAQEAMGDGVDYSTLMTVTRDDQGRVRLIQANAREMNQLTARVSLYAQRELAALEGQQVEVPLGSALGFTLFSGAGPRVKVSILPVGSVAAALNTEFASAGINQTRHTVMLRLQCTIRLVLPTGTQTASAQTEMAVAESIIVGEVPQSYFQADEDALLNLAP